MKKKYTYDLFCGPGSHLFIQQMLLSNVYTNKENHKQFFSIKDTAVPVYYTRQ